MTLPPLPEPIHMGVKEVYWNEFIPVTGYTAAQMENYAKEAIAAHVPEAGCGNIAAVPASLTDEQIRQIARKQKQLPWGIGSRMPDAIEFARAVLAAAPQGVPVPAGWALVPVEPTQAMCNAGRIASCGPFQTIGTIYAAMLAAAPKEQPHE